MNLVFLHGFLGSHRDYALVVAELKKQNVEFNCWAPDFFQSGPVSAAHDYQTWTNNFLSELKTRFKGQSCTLVGYSLGARLALHAFLQMPQSFDRLMLLSANPGILIGSAEERRAWEQKWADCFRHQSWQSAMDEWNSQHVFQQATPRITPVEGQLQRELVADSLSRWSLLTHRYTLDDLMRLPTTTEWWFGEEDQKFMLVKAELERRKVPGHYKVIKNTGHRLPLDQAELLSEALRTGRTR